MKSTKQLEVPLHSRQLIGEEAFADTRMCRLACSQASSRVPHSRLISWVSPFGHSDKLVEWYLQLLIVCVQTLDTARMRPFAICSRPSSHICAKSSIVEAEIRRNVSC